MSHFASPEFWFYYRQLPPEIRELADARFQLLKSDPRHASLRLKKVGIFWSARIGLRYRAWAKDRMRDSFGFRWAGTISTNKFWKHSKGAFDPRRVCVLPDDGIYFHMSTYPKSPNEKTNGMIYFPRMLDKIRLHARGELGEEYQKNLGAMRAADGACCNFLRINYVDLVERVKQGGTDEEILEWCFEKGRRLNEGDIVVWNGFASKLGWRDFMTPRFQELKKEQGVADRDDIACVPDLMDFEEGRKS